MSALRPGRLVLLPTGRLASVVRLERPGEATLRTLDDGALISMRTSLLHLLPEQLIVAPHEVTP